MKKMVSLLLALVLGLSLGCASVSAVVSSVKPSAPAGTAPSSSATQSSSASIRCMEHTILIQYAVHRKETASPSPWILPVRTCRLRRS